MIQILFCLLTTLSAFAGTIESLDLERQKHDVKTFTGMFMVPDTIHGERVAIVTAERGVLEMWYPVSNMASHGLSIPLNSLNKKKSEMQRRSRGLSLVESEFRRESDTKISHTEIITSRFQMSVEYRYLELKSPGHLEYHMERKYYRRKFRLFGDWVLDTTSFDGTRNSHDHSWEMLRLAAKPVAIDQYFESVRRIPVTYIQLTGDGLSADDVRDEIAAGRYRIVGADDFKAKLKPRGEVVDLGDYRRRCEEQLTRTSLEE